MANALDAAQRPRRGATDQDEPGRAGATSHRGGIMVEQNEAWVQLATRIPRRLHRDMKLHCVAQEVSLMTFVVEALREKLATSGETGRRRRAS
jgi:hypothetical protein